MGLFIIGVLLIGIGVGIFALNFTERGRKFKRWSRPAFLNQPAVEILDLVLGTIVALVFLYAGFSALVSAFKH